MATDNASPMRLIHREDRSLFNRVLQTCLRPFKPHLVTPKKVFPEGSPKLDPPANTRKRCEVKERKVDDIWLYDLSGKPSSSPSSIANGSVVKPESQLRKHRIIYFAGGSFQQPPSSQHWKLCAAIVTKLPNTIVTIVSHPLAPKSPAPVTLPQLQKLYRSLIAESRAAGELVTIAGDSSGGTIALVLAQDGLKESTLAAPDAVLVISPSTDSSKSNDAIDKLDKVDAILTASFTKSVAVAWRGDWDPLDPRVSPLVGEITSFREKNVQVIGVSGGYDVLSADALKFRDRCVEEGVRGKWLHWEGQMHCFPLAFGYRLPEAVEGFEWIVEALGEVRDGAS